MEDIRAHLAADGDWKERVTAIQKLERLALGVGTSQEFRTALRGLVDELRAQVQDRRSQVCRQICQSLGAIARAMGVSFEAVALQLVPDLLRVTSITIQIMVESAVACLQEVLRHCLSTKVLMLVLDVLCTSKAGKQRQLCAGLLLLVVQQWPTSAYLRVVGEVESAIRAVVSDQISDTRTVGRHVFAAYALALPKRAADLLR